MVSIPRLVVAAPRSGAGKTTVATGLMAALRARGLTVSGHKVGPDYIDPGYHALATGRPGRNLDPFLTGEDNVAALFAHGAAGADVAVVEGVMGLFDGRAATHEASTAHVARLLDAPVLLVVDASGQSASVAALVSGFAGFDRRVRLAGVLLNRVASARHAELLRDAVRPLGIPVLGALPRADVARVPSRHLGLVPAGERVEPAARAVVAWGRLLAAHADLDGLLALARSAPPLAAAPWSAAQAVGAPVAGSPVVAVAGGPAFTFAYPEAAELLRAAGAQVAPFDPLRDERLPAGTRALVLGGGFPEVHAAELAANQPLRAQVAALAAAGAPVYAECGGLLYLAQALDGAPMCGVLPVQAQMTERLTLGYRVAERADGRRVHGHEFHRTACRPVAGEPPAYRVNGAGQGFRRGALLASYLHVHWAGYPQLARELLAGAA